MLIALCLAPWAMGEFGYSAFLLVGTDAGLVDRYSAYHPHSAQAFYLCFTYVFTYVWRSAHLHGYSSLATPPWAYRPLRPCVESCFETMTVGLLPNCSGNIQTVRK